MSILSHKWAIQMKFQATAVTSHLFGKKIIHLLTKTCSKSNEQPGWTGLHFCNEIIADCWNLQPGWLFWEKTIDDLGRQWDSLEYLIFNGLVPINTKNKSGQKFVKQAQFGSFTKKKGKVPDCYFTREGKSCIRLNFWSIQLIMMITSTHN